MTCCGCSPLGPSGAAAAQQWFVWGAQDTTVNEFLLPHAFATFAGILGGTSQNTEAFAQLSMLPGTITEFYLRRVQGNAAANRAFSIRLNGVNQHTLTILSGSNFQRDTGLSIAVPSTNGLISIICGSTDTATFNGALLWVPT